MGKFWDLVWRRRGELYRTLVAAVLIALGIRTFLFEPFNIPSGSMKPTLLVGDYLFVSKYSYGYSRYSFPWAFPPFSGRVLESEPERGDIIVFKEPRGNEIDYIKRLIGLPGDTIQMKAGQLYINDVEVPREVVGESPDECRADEGAPLSCSCGGNPLTTYRETLPGGVTHLIWVCRDEQPPADMPQELIDTAGVNQDNTRRYVVPEGHYFMMGDNRDNSQDSRFIGAVPAENLVGRAEILFFSHKDGGEVGNEDLAEIWEVWKWGDAIRWDRLLQSLD